MPAPEAGVLPPPRGSQSEEGPWYIVKLRPGGLKRAVVNLERQGVLTYCPERPRTRRQKGRLVTAPAPLFPGYLFIAIPDGGANWRSINATYGVAAVVCLEPGRPSRLPEGLVPALKTYCGLGGEGGISPVFHPGEDVRIILGPFAEMTARIEALPDRDRIHVLLDMMGRSVRACLTPGDLERIA